MTAEARHPTLGELLATTPIGTIIECQESNSWMQFQMVIDHIDPEQRKWVHVVSRYYEVDGTWAAWGKSTAALTWSIRFPARVVPADQTKADPATRGPMPDGLREMVL